MLVAAHIRLIKRYCSGRLEDIEGWADAVSSPEPYECHHRMEIQPDGTLLSKQWMIDHGIYFNVDPWSYQKTLASTVQICSAYRYDT